MSFHEIGEVNGFLRGPAPIAILVTPRHKLNAQGRSWSFNLFANRELRIHSSSGTDGMTTSRNQMI